MNQVDLNLMKEEFNQDRNRWTDIILQRIFFYGDLKIKLAEREFQFILFLTTVSIAFISVVLPLLLNSDHKISKISIFAFMLASFFGFLRVFLSIIVDKKEIPKDEEFEIGYFKKCQKLAGQIYGKITSGDITKKDIEKDVEMYASLGRGINIMGAQRKKEKDNFSRKFLSSIHCLFLLSFAIGFFSLFSEIICYLWYIQ